MPTSNHLVPVSFHLRNFNKYTKLDLAASKNGNLTLIGENAVGKTTLANCFFPMLIDGSIATPSFNAAKGTDKLDRTGKPRNSAQDARNFNSMLLGWGTGAMKVRTGYSYMCLKSDHRQVILGIGAHRAAGSPSKLTWWFMATSNDLNQSLNLVTTDETGKSLEKADFIAANQSLGTKMEVFDNPTGYRDQVATQVYGFDDGALLSKLAAAYRLLASPILTAGNAKFSPIIDALKNAQAGIDLQAIQDIAESQRDVNYTNGLLERLKAVQNRLLKAKKAIFWRNLNHLDELTLNGYTDAQHHLEQQAAIRDRAQQIIDDCKRELMKVHANLHETTDYLTELRDALAEQKVIEDKRKQLAKVIKDLQRRLIQYQDQQEQLTTLQQKATELQTAQTALMNERTQLVNTELRPTQAQLDRQTTELPELRKLVTETESAQLATGLRSYLQHKQLQRTKFNALSQQITQGNRDVKIVSAMKASLDGCIDERVQGPLSGRTRDGLHQDNQTVHDDGASQMDTAVKAVITQRNQLLDQYPDLKVLMKTPEILDDLTTIQKKLTALNRQFAEMDHRAEKLTDQVNFNQQETARIQAAVEPDFDPVQKQAEITATQRQHDDLVVDHQLKEKYQETETAYDKLVANERRLNKKQDTQQGMLDAAKTTIADYQSRIDELAVQTDAALQTLRPYMPEDSVLHDVDEALDFVHAHHTEVRQQNYSELANYVGAQIHHNDDSGTDRNAIDTTFAERGHGTEASQMRQQRTVNVHEMTIVAFDINRAIQLIKTDQVNVQKKLDQLEVGNDAAHVAYVGAAVDRIERQYRLIDEYNQMLNQGAKQAESIKLKITLTPSEVSDVVIAEARNPRDEKRPSLKAEVHRRLNKLANDVDVADDEQAFMAEAERLLDTRQWSEFKVFIKRRQSQEGEYEEVDDKFVQSGGSGAEKAQAMVLPLLLVPKMVLNQSNVKDAPYLVMFDEFADKLDPETAKSFARTIANFGFNFIATMPSGAQNKILADGIDNIAYDVIAPKHQQPGKFYKNVVRPALIWQKEAYHESL